ncbi:MAG TPA: hypothetical protein DGP39_03020 [Verrucomicrobiales bacterium]|nr:hypothetical protein [Verrucomicrobiales bacterium]
MPTYLYETIPRRPSEKPSQFEFFQWMEDAPLTEHPETGQPVRRIISGGISVSTNSSSAGSSCCSSGSCCG